MLRKRYLRILWFFGIMLVNELFWDIFLPRIGFHKLSASTRLRRERNIARRFRSLAVQMGGVMIKVGQFLSARLDVLPREITDELSGLQDEVTPATFDPIREIIETELGVKIEEVFTSFDRTPIAAASIGQVYAAKLCAAEEDGSPCPTVVVKVQRPQIQEIVDIDLSALRIVGGWVAKYRPIRKRVNVPRLLEEFSHSLYEEIDYLHEGHNAEKFAENFKGDPKVRVPHVIWSHTTQRVLTLEDVGGIKITDYAAIEAAGINRAEVAQGLLNTYLKQVFEDGFFHADPHPGNLFVQVDAAQEGNAHPWKLVFVDFGMTGTLSETTFKGVRDMLIGVGTQDAHRLIQSYQTLEMLLPEADVEQLERASQRVFERFWGKATAEMVELHPEEAREFLDEFGDLIYEMPFQIPENLILLGRCVSILSGMCSGLDPEFNVWTSLAPYAEKLVEAEGGKWQTILDEVGRWVQKLIAIPARTDALMSRMEQGRLEVRVPTVTHELQRLERSQKRIVLAVVFGAFLLGGVQLYLGGQFWPAVGFGGAALLFLILALAVH